MRPCPFHRRAVRGDQRVDLGDQRRDLRRRGDGEALAPPVAHLGQRAPRGAQRREPDQHRRDDARHQPRAEQHEDQQQQVAKARDLGRRGGEGQRDRDMRGCRRARQQHVALGHAQALAARPGRSAEQHLAVPTCCGRQRLVPQRTRRGDAAIRTRHLPVRAAEGALEIRPGRWARHHDAALRVDARGRGHAVEQPGQPRLEGSLDLSHDAGGHDPARHAKPRRDPEARGERQPQREGARPPHAAASR